jgi:hypothetical protein
MGKVGSSIMKAAHLTQTYFFAVMRRGPPRNRDFNWMGMSFPTCDLNSLGDVFSE